MGLFFTLGFFRPLVTLATGTLYQCMDPLHFPRYMHVTPPPRNDNLYAKPTKYWGLALSMVSAGTPNIIIQSVPTL